MGTDITIYREKRVKGKWVTMDKWDDYSDRKDYPKDDPPPAIDWRSGIDVGRDYSLFSLIAKVRWEHPEAFTPKGFPPDACKELTARYQWEIDENYSHSYLDLKELKEKSMQLLLLGSSDDEHTQEALTSLISQMECGIPPEDVRIVFWFDC